MGKHCGILPKSTMNVIPRVDTHFLIFPLLHLCGKINQLSWPLLGYVNGSLLQVVLHGSYPKTDSNE